VSLAKISPSECRTHFLNLQQSMALRFPFIYAVLNDLNQDNTMSYIDRNLLQDEQVRFRTKKHMIIFLAPLVLTIFSIFATRYMLGNPILVKVIWAPWVVLALYWGAIFIEYLFSEYAVTNRRVMMREGFFYRHANETRLAAISQVNIDQSLLAQILNYGTVSINAFGAYDAFPLVSKPYEFQRQVNEQLDRTVK
jgi:uncharacterized membrane protein YdbT with pleckstrin-like domain